jgi:hypothetical protein
MSIYIVIAENDECRWNVISSFDKQKCQDYIDNLVADAKRKQVLRAKIDVFDDEWETNNDWVRKDQIKMPKWPSGLKKVDASPEMLAERDRINNLNLIISEENRKAWEEYEHRRAKANYEFIKNELQITDDAVIEETLSLMHVFLSELNRTYKIEELTVI